MACQTPSSVPRSLFHRFSWSLTARARPPLGAPSPRRPAGVEERSDFSSHWAPQGAFYYAKYILLSCCHFFVVSKYLCFFEFIFRDIGSQIFVPYIHYSPLALQYIFKKFKTWLVGIALLYNFDFLGNVGRRWWLTAVIIDDGCIQRRYFETNNHSFLLQ